MFRFGPLSSLNVPPLTFTPFMVPPSLMMLVGVILVGVMPPGLFAEDREPWTGERFTREIRPLLSNACFHCHGPDESTREAGLRLDTVEGLSQVIDSGHPEESELLRRLTTEDPAERMPPRESHKVLSQSERQAIADWIAAGAAWQQHWSFVPPQLPQIPDVEQADWCLNPIDRFVLARLEAVGLQPAPVADPHTLIRRLHLDLIGLPPTLEESERWQAIAFPGGKLNAAGYERMVSYLLALPAYGERWSRRWLDLARYADTNGYEKDRPRSIWPYRDWVVSALNQDMPFDQFTIEQIAGDMLPGASRDQLIATGFHRNTMLNEEGGIDPLEFRFHAMTDRVATTGTTWLGLTLGCCQCHTHKYDPVSHTEYYQLMGLLNNADEPELPLTNEADLDRARQNQREAERLVSQLRAEWSQQAVSSGQEVEEWSFEWWLDRERGLAVDWQTLVPVVAESSLPILTIEEDHGIFASGDTAKRDDYRVRFMACERPINALQLEALPDERLPAHGPGTTYYEGTPGDFFLTEIRFVVDGQVVPVRSASESYSKNRFGSSPARAQEAIDGDIQTGWSVHDRQGERHVAVFELAEPIAAGAELSIEMSFGRHFASSLGRFRLRAASDARESFAARDYSSTMEELLLKPDDQLTSVERDALIDEYLLRAPQWKEQSDRIRQLLRPPVAATTLVMRERPADQPRVTHRYHRGEYLQPQEVVEPGVLGVLQPLPRNAPVNRLGLSQWLVDRGNPLTARVQVNRQWAALFGTGLVKTLEDFGLQGESPSHPELLDYLAVSWIEADHWSLKTLHRRIVTSSTYMQSSKVSAAAAEVDPSNRLLSFFPRVRLEAEQLRDSLLVASGKLVPSLGGPPVRPPQPAGITEVAFGSPKWDVSTGADRYRRSLYTFQKRTAPFAMLSTFDAPSGEACIARRTVSNSPLQALTLLNDLMLIELASAAGERVAAYQRRTSADDMQAADYLFRTALVRPPTDGELHAIVEFYRRRVEADRRKANEDGPGDPHAAGWGATARAIFALDEFQTRE
jgi:hypothetical protein